MINTSYQKQKPVSNVDKSEENSGIGVPFKIKEILKFIWNEFIYGGHLILAIDKVYWV